MSGPKAADTKTDGSRTYIYPPTGEKFPSVTTILSGTDGKRYLIDWSAKLAAERAVDEIEHVTRLLAASEGDAAGRRQAAVDYVKEAAKEARELKADAGSYVHDVVEALILWGAPAGPAPRSSCRSCPSTWPGPTMRRICRSRASPTG